MILTTLLIAAAAVLAVGVIASFWDEIKNWFQGLMKKVKMAIKAVVIGFEAFMKRTKEAYIQMAKAYQKDEKGQWHVTTETRKVPESEVPPEIRAKAHQMNKEINITSDLEKELKLYL
ncbi:hypothetical protein [Paenibacillus sp. WC2504]|uniref:hypothetical protein n=1 Tax=Paenibacillus sp. WC2504 TaxID=3461403 RepID=UPI0040464179